MFGCSCQLILTWHFGWHTLNLFREWPFLPFRRKMLSKTENQYYVQGEGTSPIDILTILLQVTKESQTKARFSFHFWSISLSLQLLELKPVSRFKLAPWKSNSAGKCKINQDLPGELYCFPSLYFSRFILQILCWNEGRLGNSKEVVFFLGPFLIVVVFGFGFWSVTLSHCCFAEGPVFPGNQDSDQNFIAF